MSLRIRVEETKINSIWLHNMMNTSGGKRRLLARSRASAIQHNINTKEVSAFTFGMPPLNLQIAYSEQVKRVGVLTRNLDIAAAKAEAIAAALSAEFFG